MSRAKVKKVRKLDKICEWAARAAYLISDDPFCDQWAEVYYRELERLDDQVKALAPPSYYRAADWIEGEK